jgi:pyrimidine-nucleoside phosphorylase
MNPIELIRKKRDGGELSRLDLQDFIRDYLDGRVPDYQMSAFLMSVFFNGMTPEERFALTDVMLHSGSVIDLSEIPGVKVDKHSTGGVGDKVSLILAPMVASCGVPVPMISGRGLGHTGGTLDKLESIPGFKTNLGIAEYRRIIAATGLVMIGQTEEIAPADKRMYALRDVTSTVESIALISGSIMSKKLAEGIDALVLDIKTGNGAFMPSESAALELARALVDIGTRFGKQTTGVLTAMDQPLGYAVGNWCEVVESVECLRGKTVPDLMEVTYALGALMLVAGKAVTTVGEGIRRCEEAIWSGRAYEKFLQLVNAQGGDAQAIERFRDTPPPRHSEEIRAPRAGVISGFRTREIGVLAAEMGAGRMRADDVLDMRAGMTLRKKLGDAVAAGDVIAEVYAGDEGKVAMAASRFADLVLIDDTPPVIPPRVVSFIDAAGVTPWGAISTRTT